MIQSWHFKLFEAIICSVGENIPRISTDTRFWHSLWEVEEIKSIFRASPLKAAVDALQKEISHLKTKFSLSPSTSNDGGAAGATVTCSHDAGETVSKQVLNHTQLPVVRRKRTDIDEPIYPKTIHRKQHT